MVGTDDADHGTDKSDACDCGRQRFEDAPVLAEEAARADSFP
jgi:hypothetical protein